MSTESNAFSPIGHYESGLRWMDLQQDAQNLCQMGVLGKPFQPETALMPRGPLPVPNDVIVDETEDKAVSIFSGSDLKVMFRVWAELNPVPVTGVASVHVDHSDSASWHFDSLKSQQITPPLTYVQDRWNI